MSRDTDVGLRVGSRNGLISSGTRSNCEVRGHPSYVPRHIRECLAPRQVRSQLRTARDRLQYLSICCLLFTCFRLSALDPHQSLAQLHHTTWTAKDGVSGIVFALAQTSDGYLWVGTTNGLLRFDGISFEKYKPENNELLSSSISALLATPDGSLWIGYMSGGATHLKHGDATNYPPGKEFPMGFVRHFIQDRDGNVWAGAVGGFVRFERGKWCKIRQEWNYPAKSAWAMLVDGDGTLWVAAENRIVYLIRGEMKFRDLGIHTGPVYAFNELPDGTYIFYDDTKEIVRAFRSPLDRRTGPLPDIRYIARNILLDRDGAMWIAGFDLTRIPFPSHLYGRRISSKTPGVETLTSDHGLTDYTTMTLLEDREGDIWVGTLSGVERFRRRNLSWYPFPQWTTNYSLVAGDRGDVWVGSRGERQSMGLFSVQDPRPIPGSPDAVRFMFRDQRGAIWISSKNRLQVWKNGKFSTVAPPEPPMKLHQSSTHDPIVATSVTEDHAGTVWVSYAGSGTFQLKGESWRFVPVLKEHPDWSTTYAYTDALDRIWLSYNTQLALVDHGKIREFTIEDGLRVGPLRVVGGRDERVFVGGETGLAFLKGSRFYALRIAGRIELGVVNAILSPPSDGLWLSTGIGIVHISEGEVQKALRDPGYEVAPEILDMETDLPEQLQNDISNYSDAVLATDGALWFATTRGVARVVPDQIRHNPVAPPVSLKALVADGRSYSVFVPAALPALTKNVRISYAGLSLSLPERVRFKYRLEGWETEWQDVGTRREAFYERLSPGKYRFHVIACNRDGVWNESGATTSFSVLPAWYQTTWFRACCILIFVLLLFTMHRLRTRQLTRHFAARLEWRVAERTRIARELHDTLLQNLHCLMFQVQAASNLVDNRPEDAKEVLHSAVNDTEQAIAESQDAIRELRFETTARNSLAHLLTKTANELTKSLHAESTPPVFDVMEEGEERTLSPPIHDEVYRIAREVLRNAFRHAGAQRIEVKVCYDAHSFRLRIRDDGKGIDRAVLGSGGRTGHWGLPGIYERARRIGAKLDLWSEPGAGTEVRLTFAAALAYDSCRNEPRNRFLRSAQR